VRKNEVYFHNRSGARKATGSYFTKPFAVEHLLDHALAPALDRHLERVAGLLEEDEEAKAAEAFFDFRCVDLAMGSGHFLVAAVDRIEARLSAFLVLHPIPQVTAEVERLRAAALEALGPLGEGVEIEQSTLLRRQIARRCVYGVDKNPIAVELARLGIWIHTFVPGLPLSFLDHSLICGDSLTGIGTLEEAIDALDPAGRGSAAASFFTEPIRDVLERAAAALQRLARATDATAREISEARAAQQEALAAVAPARDLFDLVVAARLGRAAMPTAFDEVALAANPELPEARRIATDLNALHVPIAFPEVFLREPAGFDCILGNPPWEKLQVERHHFWALRFPGLRSMTTRGMDDEIMRLSSERPDLVGELEREASVAKAVRAVLMSGPYPGLGRSHADLYKAFAWRFWQIARDGGTIGVVLPRVAVGASGMAEWRREVLNGGVFSDVTTLVNRNRWVFDDVHPQFTIALVSLRKGEAGHDVTLRGPFQSQSEYAEQRHQPVALASHTIRQLPETCFPLVRGEAEARVFSTIRSSPALGNEGTSWYARSVQGDFNSTTGRSVFSVDPAEHEWPVYKGASFELWNPDTGDIYGSIDSRTALRELSKRLKSAAARANSPFSLLVPGQSVDSVGLPCTRPRIAYRRIARATDSRTVIPALVPAHCVLVDTAPYLLWVRGDERDQAFALGVLSSIPADWFARRIVEAHVDGFIMNAFPMPRPDRNNPIRRHVELIAARLAAVDERYREWAGSVGVSVDGVSDGNKEDMLAELDAAVALLYGLAEEGVRTIFETFHHGWDFESRLRAVLDHYRRLS
jgi:hypothetical protein